METMRAAVVRAFGEPLTIERVPIPVPGTHEALIRVTSSGVCHTDLHIVAGEWDRRPATPFVPGHEGHGTVVALGPRAGDVRIGDRLGCAWLSSACGTCSFCLTGRDGLCPDQHNSGFTVNGSLAEYMLVDTRYAARIPAGVDPVALSPVLCAGVSAYRGLRSSGLRPGQWVAVVGIGGLGHFAVQYAVAMGLRVAAVDVDEAKLSLARRHGAEMTVNATTQDPGVELTERLGGVHGALVTAASLSGFDHVPGMIRRGGTIVLLGLPSGEVRLNVVDTVLRGLTIRGCATGSRVDLAEALDFFAAGQITPTIDVRQLEDINEIFADLEAGRIEGRAVVDLRD